MCPARQVSVLKRQRSGLNQLIKMLQSPFSPLAGAFIRHFQTEPEFKLLKKNMFTFGRYKECGQTRR